MASETLHPYVPRDLNVPDYVPIGLSQSTIPAVYACTSLLIAAFVWILARRFPKPSKLDKVLMCWWVFTGLTHIIVEGYFVFSPEFFKEKTPTYLAEVWKEYSKADSRYVARDSSIVALEGITAVLEGPASLLAVYSIATKKSYSYLLQMAISVGQLYGAAVYFITAYLGGDNFAVSPSYYYGYYIFANSFWVWIPLLIVTRCWKKVCAAVHRQEQKKSKTR